MHEASNSILDEWTKTSVSQTFAYRERGESKRKEKESFVREKKKEGREETERYTCEKRERQTCEERDSESVSTVFFYWTKSF